MNIVIVLNYIVIIWITWKTAGTATLGNKLSLLKMIIFLLLVCGLNNISSDLRQIDKTLQQIVKAKDAEG